MIYRSRFLCARNANAHLEDCEPCSAVFVFWIFLLTRSSQTLIFCQGRLTVGPKLCLSCSAVHSYKHKVLFISFLSLCKLWKDMKCSKIFYHILVEAKASHCAQFAQKILYENISRWCLLFKWGGIFRKQYAEAPEYPTLFLFLGKYVKTLVKARLFSSGVSGWDIKPTNLCCLPVVFLYF